MTSMCRGKPISDRLTHEELSQKPRYQAELYTIFGRKQAEEYLFPKVDKKKPAKVNPKLQQYGGRAGARILWGTLRKDSHKKLLRKDKKIPENLKKSYGAFVRELVIQKGGVPVQRNFFVQDDVPDLDHLLDKTKSLLIADKHHKFELMSRSSKVNQDTTNILVFNSETHSDNPLAAASEQKSLDHYLPMQDDQEEEWDFRASYKKWIDPKDDVIDNTNNGSSVQFMTPHGSLEDILLNSRKKPVKKSASFPRLSFLTEEGCREPGSFTQKFAEENAFQNEQVPLPRPILGKTPSLDNERSHSREGSERSHTSIQRSGRPKSPGQRKPKQVKWEPLTFNALVEYSEKRPTKGAGDFLHGGTKMFPVITALQQK